MAEEDQLGARRNRFLESLDNLVGRFRRLGNLDIIQLDAVARHALIEGAVAAGMLLVGEKDLIANIQIEAVNDDVVRLGSVSHQRQLVRADVHQLRQSRARFLQARVFVVAEPRIGPLAKFLGGEDVVDHRAQHGQRRASHRTAIQVNVVRSEEPLAAHFRPVAVGIARKQVGGGQRRRLVAKRLFRLFRPRDRNPEKSRRNCSTPNEFTPMKHRPSQ